MFLYLLPLALEERAPSRNLEGRLGFRQAFGVLEKVSQV